MNCYDLGTIQAYIDGELSLEQMKEMAEHVDHCAGCQRVFHELSDLKQMESAFLNDTPTLPDVDESAAWSQFQQKLKKENNIQPLSKHKKGDVNMKNLRRIGYVAAAALLIVVTGPKIKVIADSIISEFFTKSVLEDDVVNRAYYEENGDVWDMTKNGQFFPIDEKITDKGITVHLTELYVADSRLSVHYQIEDEMGNLMDYGNKTMEDHFVSAKDNKPFQLLANNKAITENIGCREMGDPNDTTVTFIVVDDTLKNKAPVALRVAIDHIGDVSGNWEMTLPINVDHLSTEKPIIPLDPSEKTEQPAVPTDSDLTFPELQGYEKSDFGGDSVGYASENIIIMSSKREAPQDEIAQFEKDVEKSNQSKTSKNYVESAKESGNSKAEVAFVTVANVPAIQLSTITEDGQNYNSTVIFYIDNAMYSVQGAGPANQKAQVDADLTKVLEGISVK